MVLRNSNYVIEYTPCKNQRKRNSHDPDFIWNMSVNLSDEFLEFARSHPADIRKYARILDSAIINPLKWDKAPLSGDIKMSDEGFLEGILVPDKFELKLYSNQYLPSTYGSYTQFLPALAVMTSWVNDLEDRLETNDHLERSNYRIEYRPISTHQQDLRVYLGRDFIDFAKKQKVDENAFAARAMDCAAASHIDKSKSVKFEGGLLTRVNMGGASLSLVSERGHNFYNARGLGNYCQASALIATVTDYLKLIEEKIAVHNAPAEEEE